MDESAHLHRYKFTRSAYRGRHNITFRGPIRGPLKAARTLTISQLIVDTDEGVRLDGLELF